MSLRKGHFCALPVSILLLCLGEATGRTPVSKADSLYQAAAAQIGNVPVWESIQALKLALKADRDYAPAYYELAKLYVALDTPEYRARAERRIRTAIRLDAENEEYQLTLGDVVWAQGFRGNAERQYRKVFKANPNSAKAAYWIGYRALKEFLKYQHMRMLGGRFYAGKDRDRGIHYLTRCIQADPTCRNAYYQLGLLHLESGRPKKLIEVSRQLLKQFSEDKDALLFCGLGHQRIGQEKDAYLFYTAALDRMTSAERAVMESVDYLADEEEKARMGQGSSLAQEAAPAKIRTDDTERERFWRKQDPLYLTEYNERRMAHYGRVAYANLAFSRPEKGIPGWQTDMGKVHIKFGLPVRRWAQRPQLIIKPGGGVRLVPHRDTWMYEGFEFRFRNWDGLDAWRWEGYETKEALAMLDVGKWPGHPREIFRKEPPRYVDPFRTKKYSLPHLVVGFREADSVRVEIACAIPSFRLKAGQNAYGVQVDNGVFLFDEDWEETYRDVDRMPTLYRAGADSLKGRYLLAQHRLHTRPGIYTLVAEVGDRVGGSIGTFREAYAFSYADTVLTMSNLLLASRIAMVRPFPEARGDLEILPNPLRTFTRSQPVFIYLEVYNLARDDFGRTDYEISYRVGPPKKDKIDPAMFAAMDIPEGQARVEVEQAELKVKQGEPVIGGDETVEDGEGETTAFPDAGVVQPDYRVRYMLPERNRILVGDQDPSRGMETAITAQYEGDREDDFTYLQIDIARAPVGVHKLTVTVRDAKTGQMAERKVLFRVVE